MPYKYNAKLILYRKEQGWILFVYLYETYLSLWYKARGCQIKERSISWMQLDDLALIYFDTSWLYVWEYITLIIICTCTCLYSIVQGSNMKSVSCNTHMYKNCCIHELFECVRHRVVCFFLIMILDIFCHEIKEQQATSRFSSNVISANKMFLVCLKKKFSVFIVLLWV